MKDSEIRAVALDCFYKERRHNAKIWTSKDVPVGIEPIDFFDVCGQLAQHGLIDWSPIVDMFKVKSGRGKITASGVDVVEGTARSPITITFDQSHIVNITGSNNIVGDNNSMHVDEIITAINRSNASEEDKSTAKSLLQKVSENKLLNTVLGAAVGAATKHALESAK
jgi:hypothetical protein